MQQHPGYRDASRPGYLCRLNRSLYSLKQAPIAWFHQLQHFLLLQGFRSSLFDSSLFIKRQQSTTVIILVYVDDLIITGNNSSLIDQVIELLCHEFDCRDLGSLGFFLGMEISSNSGTLLLTQTRYAFDLLKKFNMENCSPCPTPLRPRVHLKHDEGELLPNATIYKSIVGGLQYLTLSQPDLAYAVNHVSQFLQQPHIFRQ